MKAKHLLILFLAAGLYLGCGGEKSGDTATGDQPTSDNPAPTDTENATDAADNSGATENAAPEGDEIVYTYHDVTYDEHLTVWKKTGAIEFVIDISNSDNACDRQIKGTAKAKEGDLESREVDGEGVFVQEYLYESPECSLVISVDMDGEEYAWVSASHCKDSDPMCRVDVGSPLSRR